MKEKIKSGIYCIENLANGKKYIGRDVSVEREVRIKVHRNELRKNKHKNSYLQNAWNKYGEDNFDFYIIKKCKKEELNDKEIYYIKKLKTKVPNGYNMTDGGGGNLGYTLSQESRKKISNANSGENSVWFGRKHTDEEKEKIRAGNIGKLVSKETRKKISLTSLGRQTMLGRHHTDETKRKISEHRKGKLLGVKKSKKTIKNMMHPHKKYISTRTGVKTKIKATSKYTGISFCRRTGLWIASIQFNKKRFFLGNFNKEINAAKAYDKKYCELLNKNKKDAPNHKIFKIS